MRKNIPDKTYTLICDLISELAKFGYQIQQPEPHAELYSTSKKSTEKRFTINDADDISNAVIKLIFGDKIEPLKKRGQKGFENADIDLVLQARQLMSDNKELNLDNALTEVIEYAQIRSNKTLDESVLERLRDVHQKMNKQEKHKKQTQNFVNSLSQDAMKIRLMTDEELFEDEIYPIYNWLMKHKKELIQLLED